MVVQKPLRIDPDALYDEGAMFQAGIPSAAVKRARRSGRLRHTRQGNRILFLGKWILAWLESEGNADSRKGVKQ